MGVRSTDARGDQYPVVTSRGGTADTEADVGADLQVGPFQLDPMRRLLMLALFLAALSALAAQGGLTRDNVARLAPAWTYRTGELGPAFATSKPTSFETTPLVVEGTMYTPLGRVIWLDPATGRERRVFDPKIRRD